MVTAAEAHDVAVLPPWYAPSPRKVAIHRYLDPAETLAEVMFGLIMVLTITIGAGLITAEDQLDTHGLIVAAAGCNVAWGVIDAIMYVLNSLGDRGRDLLVLRRVRGAGKKAEAHAAIAAALPPAVASTMSPEALEEFIRGIEGTWGTGANAPRFAPDQSKDGHFPEWWGRYERHSATPNAGIALARMNAASEGRS